MPDATRQYAALTVLFLAALFIQAGNTLNLTRMLLQPDRVASAPFAILPATRIIAGGPFAGDALLAVNGHPFDRARQLVELIQASRPGDFVSITLSRPDGLAVERTLKISATNRRWSQIALVIALNLIIPLGAMALGFAVVFILPRDRNAWLLLFLMIGFTETVRNTAWQGPLPDLTFLWGALWKSIWPIAMIFFGVYFPTRSLRDRRWPWVKYLAVVIFLAVEFSFEGINLLWQHDVNAADALRGAYSRLYFLQLTLLLLANGTFFRSLRIKSAAETTSDARRRLSVLRWGSWLGLGPTLVLFVYAFFTRSTAFSNVPWPITFPALLLLTLFPLTLAYVIVVERAMDLRFVIRMGMRYGFARLGLWVARAALVALAIYIFSRAATRPRMSSWEPVQLFGVGGALLVLRKQGADRASAWIDRRFFREAYDAERVLTGLASEVSRYLEVRPLIERVAGRIGETLHVAEIVILLRTGNQGDEFRTEYSTRPGQPMDIPLASRIVTNLEKRGEPLAVYFDQPAPWIRSLDGEELQTLDFMRTQLLLPLFGRDQLIGIISLGPKLSEIPYSDTDIRLLQAVAAHTGMALENSRLLASLAKEAAAREGANRELEIAREVQDRLFPQSCPRIAGLECAGYCRPARGVGGDYYDFLALPDGKLGIAIGDVSGKGIAAALLMASLQASLRGQVISGRNDLAVLMANMNRLIFEASTDSRYATLLYAEYNPATRDLCYVNAGHNAPFVMRGDQLIRLCTGGPVVGLLPDPTYEQAKVKMQPGDIFVAFTDGISEAMTESEEEWDEDRLIEATRKNRALRPQEMIQAIIATADAFTGAAKQNDDMTLVVIRLI